MGLYQEAFGIMVYLINRYENSSYVVGVTPLVCWLVRNIIHFPPLSHIGRFKRANQEESPL